MIFIGYFLMDREQLMESIYEVMGEPSEKKEYVDDTVVFFYERKRKIFKLQRFEWFSNFFVQLISIYPFRDGREEYMRAKAMSFHYDGKFKPIIWTKIPGKLLFFTRFAFIYYRFFMKPLIKPDPTLSEKLNSRKIVNEKKVFIEIQPFS